MGLIGQILKIILCIIGFRKQLVLMNRKLIGLFTLSLFCMLYILTLPLFPALIGLGYYLITKIPASEGEK